MEKPTHFNIGYSKSSMFRTIRVDGAWGGVTPKLEIFMALWGERPSIPDRARYPIIDEGLGAEEIEFDVATKPVAIRDVEVGISIDKATANLLIDWLKTRVSDIEKLEQQNKEKEKEKPQVKQ